MTKIERLSQLRQMLASPQIGERRAGIKTAQEMLTNELQREQVRELLGALAGNDPIGSVREDAQSALDADEARHYPSPAAPPDYVFGARCPNGHVSYYDKRGVCSPQSAVTRRTVSRDAREVDEVLLKCKTKTCGLEFFAEVDCEGHK